MPAPSLNRVRAAPFRDDRHYFHRPTWVSAWRVRLAVLALVLAGGWVAASMVGSESRYAISSHGELARAHAPWANKCEACHVPHGSPEGAGSGLFETRDRWHTFRCESCHAGPADDPKNYDPHYDRKARPHLADDPQARDCSSCHHDHQGKDVPLARLADADCTRCHQNLSPLHGTGPAITAFPKDHPDFRAKLAGRPARGLKFNHALHLATGLTERANLGNPNAVFKFGQVYPHPTDRERYKRFATGASPEAAVRLDCSACHEPAGGGYKPVVFDRHCQGCHTSNLTVGILQSPGGVTTGPFTIPHGRPVSELGRLLRSEVLRQIDGQKDLLGRVPLPPSDRLDGARVSAPSDLGKEADALTKLAAGALACEKCHQVSHGSIRPTGTPALWLPAARFDHTAHRMMKCADCHTNWDQAAIVRGAGPEPLNLPGIDNCRQCHAPAGSGNAGVLGLAGGVRHDCTTCHRYHGPRHP